MSGREMRYSATYDGWFWEVAIENPSPIRMPDGSPSRLDIYLRESGFVRRRKGAERAMRRAERRLTRRVAKATKLVAS